MSIKIIERMLDYCVKLLDAFNANDKKKIIKWLVKLEKENKEELSSGKEFDIEFLKALHGLIAKEITNIKKNLDNSEKCKKSTELIFENLRKIIDQRIVRDQIIKEVIHPILKSWGYKKKARSFVKKEEKYTKKLFVVTSQFCDYYEVDFTFEISIEGPDVDLFRERISRDWFEITQDTDLKKLKAQITAQLLNEVKTFLDKYK